MVEQAAVNRAVVGSSPTEAAIHCRVDELVSRIALNDEVAGSNPALAIKPCGVIGNIAPFEGEDSRYPSGSKLRVLVGLSNFALVAQLEEAAVSKTVSCGFNSHQEYQNLLL